MDRYESQKECKDKLSNHKRFKFKKEELTGEESIEQLKKPESLPNIEPLTRGIALNLMLNDIFKKHFCILIVHNQKINYFSESFTGKQIFEEQCIEFQLEAKEKKY